MHYYVGLDVGLKQTFICVVDDSGRQIQACDVATDAKAVSRALAKLKAEDAQRQGRISRCGPAECRAMLFEAAHCLLHFYKGTSHLKRRGQKVARKKGMKRAIVAVARRMAVIMHRMLITGEPFDDARLKAA